MKDRMGGGKGRKKTKKGGKIRKKRPGRKAEGESIRKREDVG